ncbi:MAG: hypothetical protein M3P97_11495 [Actinomycetota bacterium]|nr:hypothetical protein [Actinomycetota bacterium]
MIRRLFRFVLKLALVAGAGAAVSKVLQRRRSEPFPPAPDAPWPPIDLSATPRPVPDPAPAVVDEATLGQDAEGEAVAPEGEVVAVPAEETADGWVEPDDEGDCADSHPVKAKMGSGVFHLPGMANYGRTKADRCYRDKAAAEADGLRQAKR